MVTLVDITSGAVTEVIRVLQATIDAMQTVQVLGQFGPELALEDLYIPVKVSQQRLRNRAEDRTAEGRRLRGDPDDEQRAYAAREEEDFLRGKARTEEIILQWQRARDRYPKAVVLGDPGQGKSTLLRWEACTVARTSLQALQRQEAGLSEITFPLYVRLAEVAPPSVPRTKAELQVFLRQWLLPGDYSERFRQWFEKSLENGTVVFLLDALDEVLNPEHRVTLKKTLEALIAIYPQCRYVLTSRIVSYDGCVIEQRGGKVLELVAFGHKETQHFVRAWFANDEGKQHGMQQALQKSPALRRLAHNPLLLSLLCLLYNSDSELPERTVDLYRKCLEGFLRDWRNQKKLPPISEERLQDKITLLEDIALQLWELGKEYFSLRELKSVLENYPLYQSLLDDASRKSLIHELSTEDGILVKAGVDVADVPYMFLHLTFQEYLAACALERRKDWQVIVERWMCGVWESRVNVLLFLAGELKEATPLIEILLKHDDSRPLKAAIQEWQPGNGVDPFGNVLELAARCVSESCSATDKVMAEIQARTERRIGEDLFEPNSVFPLLWLACHSQAAGEAIASYAIVGARYLDKFIPALRLVQPLQVFSALAQTVIECPPGLEDRWLAIYFLGKLGRSEAIPLLAQVLLDTQDVDREVAAEALGNLGDRRAMSVLSQVFNDQLNPWNVHVAAAEALGQLHDPEAVFFLCKLSVDIHIDPETRSHAIRKLGKIRNPQIVPVLQHVLYAEAWTEDHSVVYAQALDAIGSLDDIWAVPFLCEVSSKTHPHLPVREMAIRTLGQIGDPQAIPVLRLVFSEMQNKDNKVLLETAITLGQLGDLQSIPMLDQLLINKQISSYHRARIALVLEQLRVPEVISILMRTLTDVQNDKYVRGSTIEALGYTDEWRAAAALQDLFADTQIDSHLRLTAALTLTRMGKLKDVPFLVQALLDSQTTAAHYQDVCMTLASLDREMRADQER